MTAPLTPLDPVPPPTKGAAPNEKGQRSWWDDPDLLGRVRRVHSLTEQGLFATKIARMLKVSERTVHEDRARYLELLREDIKQDVKDHIARLDQTIEEAWAAFHAFTPSNAFAIKRSDYLNIIRQAVMDKAKLDGSLNADPIQIGIQVNVGPSPNELYDQGKLTDEAYESHLRVLALQSGAEVIEGDVVQPAAEANPLEAVAGASPPPKQREPLPGPRRRATSSPPKEAVVPLPAAASPSDPTLADFVPDDIPEDDEEE
jgi:hypothetical protein